MPLISHFRGAAAHIHHDIPGGNNVAVATVELGVDSFGHGNGWMC